MLIRECIGNNSFYDAYESLKIYKNTFGSDSFTEEVESLVRSNGPLVSLICLNCPDEMIDEFLLNQNYSNLEVVRTSKNDSYEDIVEYFSITESKYICFLETNHSYNSNKIAEMVWHLEMLPEMDIAITLRNFVDSANTVIAHPDYVYRDTLSNTAYYGKTILESSINEDKNLYGTLSTFLVSTKYARSIPWEIPEESLEAINRISLIYQFLLYGKIVYMGHPLVSTVVEDYCPDGANRAAYEVYVASFGKKNSINISNRKQKENADFYSDISRSITFFYTDKGEYYNLKPIADEAARRGFDVTFTENITQKAEIGVYCQHICYPENSKFSLILLHDLAQGHNRWPNLWELERWDKFDIGIVPGKSWASLWRLCANQYYANPRFGVYEFGYPKSDLINDDALKRRAEELRQKFQLKYNFSVLYAPSWENDEKEDDFVRALASLNVNLLIKQAHWSEAYGHIITNIKEMRKSHENKYDNVYYIEPEESIMTALELCDMVVSDESSVMSEAVMFGKPSVAVTDWLIPDTTPSRFASVPMDYVLKCKKVELREYVENLAAHSTDYDSILEKGRLVFSNQGHCCSDILDAVEYYTNQKTESKFLRKKLTSKYTMCSMWN